ncbi:hypothetical protein BaRGS_00025769 [Batillaria attramentaria]|uniref:Uncharacterized protein n=1 Tax=Batillaria attramentaria TaxID=370345 RepID=A0ABD0K6C8_9CAEN
MSNEFTYCVKFTSVILLIIPSTFQLRKRTVAGLTQPVDPLVLSRLARDELPVSLSAHLVPTSTSTSPLVGRTSLPLLAGRWPVSRSAPLAAKGIGPQCGRTCCRR